ncbi:MAG: CPBP family intramembrane glutamic endopeptidase [Acidobacteriota bacterium]
MNAPILRDKQEKSARPARNLLGTILDPRRKEALAVVAAWLAFVIGLVVDGTVDGVTSFGVAGAVGAVIVVLGFAAASRCRTLPQRSNEHGIRLVFLTLAMGAGVGLVNLAANWGITEADPALRALLVERMMAMQPWEALVAGPITEEVVFRLFVMSVMAWVVYRVTKRAGRAFVIALIGSAAIFAFPHLERPLPADPMLADYYRAALMTKYILLGVPLGWVFWRWGLPYAILCHSAANATHMALQWGVF